MENEQTEVKKNRFIPIIIVITIVFGIAFWIFTRPGVVIWWHIRSNIHEDFDFTVNFNDDRTLGSIVFTAYSDTIPRSDFLTIFGDLDQLGRDAFGRIGMDRFNVRIGIFEDEESVYLTIWNERVGVPRILWDRSFEEGRQNGFLHGCEVQLVLDDHQCWRSIHVNSLGVLADVLTAHDTIEVLISELSENVEVEPRIAAGHLLFIVTKEVEISDFNDEPILEAIDTNLADVSIFFENLSLPHYDVNLILKDEIGNQLHVNHFTVFPRGEPTFTRRIFDYRFIVELDTLDANTYLNSIGDRHQLMSRINVALGQDVEDSYEATAYYNGEQVIRLIRGDHIRGDRFTFDLTSYLTAWEAESIMNAITHFEDFTSEIMSEYAGLYVTKTLDLIYGENHIQWRYSNEPTMFFPQPGTNISFDSSFTELQSLQNLLDTISDVIATVDSTTRYEINLSLYNEMNEVILTINSTQESYPYFNISGEFEDRVDIHISNVETVIESMLDGFNRE